MEKHIVTQEQYDLLCDARKRFAELDEETQLHQRKGDIERVTINGKELRCGCFGAWLTDWYFYRMPGRPSSRIEPSATYMLALRTFERLFGIPIEVVDRLAFLGRAFADKYGAFGPYAWEHPPSEVLATVIEHCEIKK